MKFLKTLLISVSSILCAFDSTIPVLHLPDYTNEHTRPMFLEKLEKAISEVGFFGLTGTGVDPALLDSSYAEIVKFFAQDPKDKLPLQSKDGQRGYVVAESAKGETRIDCKEFYHVGREFANKGNSLWAENVWPESPSTFKDGMVELYQAMDTCKDAIGDMLTDLCHLEKGAINSMIDDGDCLMRAIHYPGNPPANSIWAGAHTDIDFFTILPRSTAKGLQVLNHEGNWVDIIVPDGAFIINCGDMLENMSNGFFKSAVHRVVDGKDGKERYSVVFFVHPRSNDRLDPLTYFIERTGGIRKYANVTRLELLAERLIDLGLASPSLMEFFVNSGAIAKLQEVGRFSPKAEDALKTAGFLK